MLVRLNVVGINVKARHDDVAAGGVLVVVRLDFGVVVVGKK